MSNFSIVVKDKLTAFLVTRCCQNLGFAKSIFSVALDGINGGALELFPTVDLDALRREKMDILSKIRDTDSNSTSKDKERGTISGLQQNGHPNQRRPPQLLIAYPELQNMLYV